MSRSSPSLLQRTLGSGIPWGGTQVRRVVSPDAARALVGTASNSSFRTATYIQTYTSVTYTSQDSEIIQNKWGGRGELPVYTSEGIKVMVKF